MGNLRRLLSRRWLLGLLGLAALILGLAMLHPYPRQSLFGPTIRGEPWCVWEEAVRRYVHREDYEKSVAARLRRWLGFEQDNLDRDDLFNHKEMLPLLLEMAEDHDHEVRRCVLIAFITCDQLHDRSALPVLRRRFDDAERQCRIKAAVAAWVIDPNEPVVAVLLREADDRHSAFRLNAIHALTHISRTTPELMPHVDRYAADEDEAVRADVMIFVQGLGAKALPILRRGADDRSSLVRRSAINSIYVLNSAAKDLVPVLVRLLTDQNDGVRNEAADTIRMIDPDRYEQLKAEGKIE